MQGAVTFHFLNGFEKMDIDSTVHIKNQSFLPRKNISCNSPILKYYFSDKDIKDALAGILLKSYN